jgi:sugar lactone lactonase YvrE
LISQAAGILTSLSLESNLGTLGKFHRKGSGMEGKATRRYAAGLAVIVTTAGLLAGSGLVAASASAQSSGAFVGPLHHTSKIASTVPGNGDVNPYGVAVIPSSTGDLSQGDILVTNFNDKGNVQGTGTTIVQVTPAGKTSVFATISKNLPGCPGGVGLTTALTALQSGWVIVGSLPTKGGRVSGAGCLIVLDRWGHVRETFTGKGINGPWDMTADDLGDQAVLFVTNVLNGTVAANGHTVWAGSVVRLDVAIPSSGLPYIWYSDQIGSLLPERLNSAALVIGPTGLGLGADGTLYIADTLDNRITGIPDALEQADDPGPGHTVSAGGHLNGPLGLAIAPDGDILTANGGNGNLVEITPSGTQVAVQRLDGSGSPPGAGALFGLAVAPNQDAVYFVDDATNQLDLLHR